MHKKIMFITITIVLSIFAIMTIYPMIFVILTSFKNNTEFYSDFWGLPSQLLWSNYSLVFGTIIGIYAKNSLIYSSLNLLLDLSIASLAGFAFARYKIRYKEVLFYLVLVFMMVPGILLLVPMYVEVADLHGLNNIWGLILPWTASDLPLGTFILRRFFQTESIELFEAAKVDGASEFRIFFQIALPLAKPALTIVAILDVLFTMNDFLWPLLIMTKPETQPLAVGLLNYSGGSGGVLTWGNVFAAYVLAMIPLAILFAIFSRQFVEALTEGAIK